MSGNFEWLLNEVRKALETDKEFDLIAECQECKKLDEAQEQEDHDDTRRIMMEDYD